MTVGTTTSTPRPPQPPTPMAPPGASALNQLSGNFSTFLTLLTTQLKNQDPTSPMDSNEFTQQLVEYSQVEQQIDTNTNLQTLITQGTTKPRAVTTSYLGKNVSVTNGQGVADAMAPRPGPTIWARPPPRTQLTVTNSSGQTVYTGSGATAAGNNTFSWNGQDNNGNQLH